MKTFTCTFQRDGVAVAWLTAQYAANIMAEPVVEWRGEPLLTPAWRDFRFCEGMDFSRRAGKLATAAGVTVAIEETGDWQELEM